MVSHDRPAWAPSRIRNSKRTRSSCTGTPHSVSWYATDRSDFAHRHRGMPASVAVRASKRRYFGMTETKGNARGGLMAPAATLAFIMLATVAVLRYEGRVWWCDCRTARPWVGDVWTSHCSQHLSDPYSLTHLSHGLIFFGLLYPLRRQI